MSSTTIIKQDGEVIFYPHFFSHQESHSFWQDLQTQIHWQQEEIRLFGKMMKMPRLTAWYGDQGITYTYSGLKNYPQPWISVLTTIKVKLNHFCHVNFNGVLLNYYRHGQDSMAWHSDNEPELGDNPIIASVSFGGSRRFSFKHKQNRYPKVNLELTPGSLLIMKGATQTHWLHQIPKSKKLVEPRINLTFRQIQQLAE